MENNGIILRKYCLIGLDDVEEIKKDLEIISESVSNFATGENLIIATFSSSLNIIEIEEFFNIEGRAYIIFEMLPATYSANLLIDKFQKALFGGKIDNSEFVDLFKVRHNMENTFKEFTEDNMESVLEDFKLNISNSVIEDIVKPNPTVDEILDKINDEGINKLTPVEKEILNNHSKK